VRTGKSASAALIYCALHPLAIKERLNTGCQHDSAHKIQFHKCLFPNQRFGFSYQRPRRDSRPGCPAKRCSALLMAVKQNRHRPKPMAIMWGI